MVSKTRREDGPSKGRAVRTCGDRDGQKNGSDVSFLSSGVRQDREGKGREKGKGRRGKGWVGGSNDEYEPGVICSAILSRTMIAPMGKPFASGFAIVIMSGWVSIG